MKLIQMADPVRYPRMTTEELRATFLLDGLFKPGEIALAYVDLDRTVIGSAVPLETELPLPCRADSSLVSLARMRHLQPTTPWRCGWGLRA